MDQNVEERVRDLAQPMWESAARPYGMALDFWLMAEQMVLEMMTTVSKLQADAVVNAPVSVPEHRMWPPDAVPVARIQRLAECMWDSAGRQYGMAQDFWLAAERHVLAMIRASTAGTISPQYDEMVEELGTLAPEAYLDRIRIMAFYLWEAAGRQYGSALDYWLEAERSLLHLLSNASATVSPPAVPPEDRAPA
jgi:hypothetical protein